MWLLTLKLITNTKKTAFQSNTNQLYKHKAKVFKQKSYFTLKPHFTKMPVAIHTFYYYRDFPGSP